MSARIEVFEDAAGEWRWRLIGGNGEKMAASEGYPSRDGADRGVDDAIEAMRDPKLEVIIGADA